MARKYSLMRAINAAVSNDWSGARLERQLSQEVAERFGRSPRGFFLPAEWMRARPEMRDLSVGIPSGGGYLVATDLLAESFIDLLRNKMAVRQAGALVLGDLVGDVDIPKQTGGATGHWIGEGAATTESTPTFGHVGMTPKTVSGWIDLTRRFVKQSSLDAEGFVRNDLATVLSLAIDYAALHGSGSGAQPLGVANTSGIGDVAGGANGAAPTWPHVVELETDVATANADLGRLAYITNAKVRAKLKQTEKIADSGQFVWSGGPTPLNDYPAFVTNQVRDDLDKGTSTGVCSAIFFGNWADLVIGLWGPIDILVDPYMMGTSGGVRVTAFQDIDIVLRHAESFSAMQDALTT